MEDYFDHDKAKLFVYLLSDGDNSNKAVVSDNQLLIIRKNQKKLIQLDRISFLKTEVKKMLFPILIGGIMTPFAIVSFFTNLFQPYFHVITGMSGMLLLYIGWIGKSAFTVVLKNSEELIYYLPSISNNLKAFITFMNTSLSKPTNSELHELLFFDIAKEDEAVVFGKIPIKENQELFPIYGWTYTQFLAKRKTIQSGHICAINPLKAGLEVKFQFDSSSNQMRPKLDGPILEDSKVDTFNF